MSNLVIKLDGAGGQDLSNYVKKNSEAELKKLKLLDNKENQSVELYQSEDKNTVFYPTGDLTLKSKDKDTGTLSSTIVNFGSNKAQFYVHPVLGNTKLGLQTNTPITLATSFGDLKTQDNKTITQWLIDNPEYTPTEFIDAVFSCKVLGYSNWIASITTNNTYNNTFPKQTMQIEFHCTGGDTRNYIEAFNKNTSERWTYTHIKNNDPIFEKIATEKEVNYSISENNDKILSPIDGIEKPIEDEDKSENGYGKQGNSTYFQPIQGLNQSLFLEKIDYSKIWAIHSKVNSTFINLAIHEDIVGQIFNKDVTGINSFSLLLDPLNSKGKLGKYNQQAIEGEKISFNGDFIPSNEDANNPTKWINNDDEVTEEYTNIKNVTYSAGSFVNVGGTISVRGDISCDIENSTSTIVQDSSSKYFVIQAKAGGGVFETLKLFPFYIARLKTIVEDYGIYFFEDNADAIGKFLEIIYQAAVENNDELEKQEELKIQSLFAFDNQNILINNLKVG